MSIFDYTGAELSASIAALGILSVKDFGAAGDGVSDDTTAIQGALDALQSGGTILFPKGTYLITRSLTVYSHQTVDLCGSTILQGAAINNLMMGYCTSSIGAYDGPHDIVIENGTFDGGAYTTNNTLLGFCHGKNITIRNCKFINAYGSWHNIEINSSKFVVIEGCSFEGLRKTDANGCMIQVDSFNNSVTWPWGNGLVDNTISYMVEIRGCHFYDNIISPAVGNHSQMAVNYIRIHDCTFEGLTSTRGAVIFQSASHVDVYSNIFSGCDKIMTVSSTGSNSLTDNRIDGATTISGSNITAYSNMIDGALVV